MTHVPITQRHVHHSLGVVAVEQLNPIKHRARRTTTLHLTAARHQQPDR
jgi:hypothetical protein